MQDVDASWARSPDDVLRLLDSGPSGLSADEARRRLRHHGPNLLPGPPTPSPWRRLLRQFGNLLLLILMAAATITALLGHWLDTIVILAVVLINALVGFIQEGRAERALEALRDLLAPRASVWRDDLRQEVTAVDLVPGDRVQLDAGDRIPADLRLISVQGLVVDEALLTGESVPVRKDVEPVAGDAVMGDRTSLAFSGTMVAEGTAVGVVVATGLRTEIGRISELLQDVPVLVTPLTRQMGRLARWLAGVILVVALLILAVTTLGRGMAFTEAFMIVVGLFVAAIPEGLPTVLTVTLALGVQAMARRNAIIRRMPAVETLGAVSTICTDKTGTLTRNEMTVVTLATTAGDHRVTGIGLEPTGEIRLDGSRVETGVVLSAAGRIAGLCNSAHLQQRDGSWRVEGDPMEGALLVLAGKLGGGPGGTGGEPGTELLDTIPFDPRYRYMAVLHRQPGEGARILVKGAPESLLDSCDRVLAEDGPVSIDRGAWHARAEAIAARGQRVLALAQAGHDGEQLRHEDLASGLVLVGLVGLIDPPREEAIRAVADCRAAGIRVKMITGDHRGTAMAIAREIGLERIDSVLTGADIDELDDAALAEAAAVTDVFARTSPEHKLRLVRALQADGAVVAMTGDGVNDAPALHRADAGIAMGRNGSEAARQASDLVLADDNFASIAAAVREGRIVYTNLRKMISFLLPVNGGESLSLLIAALFGLALPIAPLQILWVNMISSVILVMALAFEPPEGDLMRRPPRDPDESMLSRFLLWRILLISVLFTAGIFGQFALAQTSGASEAVARTMALDTLVAMEVFYLFSVRYAFGSALTLEGMKGTPAVLIAVAAVVVLQLLLGHVPLLNLLFGTAPLSLLQLLQCAVPGVLLLGVLELDRRMAAFWKMLAVRRRVPD